MITKCSNLVQGYPTSGMVLGLKSQWSMLGLGSTAIWRGFELYGCLLFTIALMQLICAVGGDAATQFRSID